MYCRSGKNTHELVADTCRRMRLSPGSGRCLKRYSRVPRPGSVVTGFARCPSAGFASMRCEIKRLHREGLPDTCFNEIDLPRCECTHDRCALSPSLVYMQRVDSRIVVAPIICQRRFEQGGSQDHAGVGCGFAGRRVGVCLGSGEGAFSATFSRIKRVR